MDIKNIAGLTNVGMGVALAKHNYDLASKKKIKTKDIIKTGAGTIVGLEMMKMNAANIALL